MRPIPQDLFPNDDSPSYQECVFIENMARRNDLRAELIEGFLEIEKEQIWGKAIKKCSFLSARIA
jgi:hypothetical protein